MMTDNIIQQQLGYTLSSTNYSFIGSRYEGKVRDCYKGSDCSILVTTDRLSAFDVVVTTIPFKGQVLNQLAQYWFEKTKDLIENHIISVPDPNVMIVKNCKIVPVEVVVRGYLAGSAWRDYQEGKAVSGITLPKGMSMYQKLDTPLLTPSTKAPKGDHDLPISEGEIVSSGLIDSKSWEQISKTAKVLFDFASNEVAKRGLILVDTKYEFGFYDGRVILADEIHTLDSSRYWVEKTYAENIAAGKSPEMLDKEPVRQWLLSQGYKGDGTIPTFSDEYRVEIAKHYINSFEKIVGHQFEGISGSVEKRIEDTLKKQFS